MHRQQEIDIYRTVAAILEDIEILEQTIKCLQDIANNDRRHVIELENRIKALEDTR